MHRKFDPHEIPIISDDKLNERYYGDLQGMNKDEARKKWGEKKVFTWRRSYDIAPPHGESLKDVVKRVIPFFKTKILPELKNGKNVIVSAHGNSLRAMIKHIDHISVENICQLELPYATPIVYEMRKSILKKVTKEHAFTRPVHWHRNKKRF
jgi:2,3-bisphosphoglycerate-dependent phosphoglycerate mutase